MPNIFHPRTYAPTLANKNLAINSIVGAAFGGEFENKENETFSELCQIAAGQRCMAISVGMLLRFFFIFI
jgi:hypothetical protein